MYVAGSSELMRADRVMVGGAKILESNNEAVSRESAKGCKFLDQPQNYELFLVSEHPESSNFYT